MPAELYLDIYYSAVFMLLFFAVVIVILVVINAPSDGGNYDEKYTSYRGSIYRSARSYGAENVKKEFSA